MIWVLTRGRSVKSLVGLSWDRLKRPRGDRIMPPPKGEEWVDFKVDEGEFYFDLLAPLLEFQFRGHAEAVGYRRIGKDIEALGLKSQFLGNSLFALVTEVDLSIAAKVRAGPQSP